MSDNDGAGYRDPVLAPAMIDRARAFTKTQETISASRLQRELRIGYNDASSLIYKLQLEGLVSRPDAKGRRYVRDAEGALFEPEPQPRPPKPAPTLELRFYGALIVFLRWIARMRGRNVG